MPSSVRKTYRLVLSADGRGDARIIEFEGLGAEAALTAIERHCDGREAQVFEDGRCLGRVQNHRATGFWMVAPGGEGGLAQ